MSSRLEGSHRRWRQHQTLVTWMNGGTPVHLSALQQALKALLRPRAGYSDEYLWHLRQAIPSLLPQDFLKARVLLRLRLRVDEDGVPVRQIIRDEKLAGEPKMIDSGDARNVAIPLVVSAIREHGPYLDKRRQAHRMLPTEHICQLPEVVAGDPIVAYSRTRLCPYAAERSTRCGSPTDCYKYGCPYRLGGPFGSRHLASAARRLA
jgi:hypothetical protein